MNKDAQEYEQFLQDQLEWCQKQDRILKEIESKLYQMKQIAQYVLEHELTEMEREQLNVQFNDLKNDAYFLQRQLNATPIH